MAEIDAAAMREHLLVERDRVRLVTEKMQPQRSSMRQRLRTAEFGRAWRRPHRLGSSSRRAAARTVNCSRRPAAALTAPTGSPNACSGAGLGEIFGLDDFERPQRDRRGQSETGRRRCARARDRSASK